MIIHMILAICDDDTENIDTDGDDKLITMMEMIATLL